MFLGSYFLFMGIGFALALVYVTIRWGIPLFIGFLGLMIEAIRQIAVGFWLGITGKAELPRRDPQQPQQ